MRKLFLIAGAILAATPLSAARADDPPPMVFQVVHVSSLYDAVYANGTITADTTKAFADFLKANPVRPGVTVYFNSPGGDLGSGLTLGEAIRKAELDTTVGIPAAGSVTVKPSMCASACTFAFLGGVQRTVPAKSMFGVHRFELTKDVKNVEKKSQKIAGQLVDYIGRMGVSQEMYAYSTIDGNDAKNTKKQILWLDAKTLVALKIVTTEQIKAAIVDRNGMAILVVKDMVGSSAIGELDFYCQDKILVARGYFAKPASTYTANTPLNVNWIVATNSYAVPSGQYRVVPQSSGDQQLAVDVEVTPQILGALLPAKSVSIQVKGPSSYAGSDGVGAGSPLPAKVQTLLKIMAACG